VSEERFDVVLLDVMLPDGEGFTLCREIQGDGRHADTAVVFLTARDATEDRIAAFRVGADDYVEKPFDRRELHARVTARLRRLQGLRDRETTLVRGELRLDLRTQKAAVRDQDLDLTPHEFRLLFQLARDEDRPRSRRELMESVWGNVVVYERTIDSHLSNLRKKLGPCAGYIRSVRGIGYRFSTSG
jgi:two-component system response regulator ResD